MNPEPSLTAYIAPALCVGARVSGWLTFTPFLGHAALPNSVKAILTLGFTILLFPVVATTPPPGGVLPGPMVLVGELSVGMIMGLCLQLVFEGIQLGGTIIGTQLGFSMANLIDPMSQVETTVVAVFHQTIALLMFLQMDIHHSLVLALARSFRYLPAGTVFQIGVPAPQPLPVAAGSWLI